MGNGVSTTVPPDKLPMNTPEPRVETCVVSDEKGIVEVGSDDRIHRVDRCSPSASGPASEKPEITDAPAAHESDPDLDPPRPITYVTTKGWLLSWVVLHLTYMAGGGAVGVWLFAHRWDGPVRDSLLAAAAMALSGAGCYYLRRIYKASIQGRMQILSSSEARTRMARVIGTSLYLLCRPLIAALLAIFLAMTVCVTWYGVATPGSEPGLGLVQLASVYGFLVGYFSGRSISQLESSGKITV